MSKLPEEYLKHILDEVNYLLDSSRDVTKEKFMHNPTLQRAYSRSLEITGEAAKNLPADFRNKYSEIDWKKVAGMRDKLIHHYFGVDYEIVWDVVKNEMPRLKKQVKDILGELQS